MLQTSVQSLAGGLVWVVTPGGDDTKENCPVVCDKSRMCHRCLAVKPELGSTFLFFPIA